MTNEEIVSPGTKKTSRIDRVALEQAREVVRTIREIRSGKVQGSEENDRSVPSPPPPPEDRRAVRLRT